MLRSDADMPSTAYGEGSPLMSAIYGGGQLSIFVGWIVVCILDEYVLPVSTSQPILTPPLQMHRSLPRRTGLSLPNLRRPLLLDLPTLLSQIPQDSLLYKRLDMVDWKLDYNLVCELRLRVIDCWSCGNVPSGLCDDQL
jgi:hypothetical protein